MHKFWAGIKGFARRIQALFLVPFYDVIFIHREASPLGVPIVERIIARLWKKHYIYDFDDAIWKLDITESNKALSRFRYTEDKTPAVMRMAGHILAGNEYLATYAKQYNSQISIFPTLVNTDYHRPIPIDNKPPDKICIGWTGTHTTIKHFELLLPVLERIYALYPSQVYFKLIVNADLEYTSLDLRSTRWTRETEIEALNEFDIGLMPLPNDEWSKGKCGFKIIQYLALEIASIASAVGVNRDIIEDDVNGILVDEIDEFFPAIKTLIEDKDKRERFGKMGRAKIISSYSSQAYADRFQQVIESA